MRQDLPTGTVTFLFTDIEGSTKLLRELGPAYGSALAEHRRIIRSAAQMHGGVEVDTQGDAFFLAFDSPDDAVCAALEAQAALDAGPISVRMGLHTGEAERTAEGYVGLEVHRGARIAAAGHGGQVVLSATTRSGLADGVILTDLGEHRLKDFEESVRLFQLGDGLFPPLRTIGTTNLPRPASSFVGRTQELEMLLSRVRGGARIVTLTGPGGTGKTRLAIEAATELLAAFPAGVIWVGLADVWDPALVLRTVGQTLGASGTVADHISDREMLLVLDNFEQVVDAAKEVSELVRSCPNLVLLISSRELLRIDGEFEFGVPALDLADARELFASRTGLDPAAEIDELCARLDNMPLALELAAALTRVLSPAQILERLDQRLDLFRAGRDVDPRQQTLRSTIEWSYDLLTGAERSLFAKLSVVRGGCSLEAAEKICDAEPVAMQGLVNKSLVRRTGERFWMLETIRDYALERLRENEESDRTARRHFEYFLALAESANLTAEAEQGRRPELVQPETDNLRAAFEWVVSAGEVADGYRLAIALENFWVTLDPFEGMMRFETLFAAGGEVQPVLRARALRCYGGSSDMAGLHDQARLAYEQSLALFRDVGDERDVAILLHRIGTCLLNLRCSEGARRYLEESLEIFRTVGSARGVAQAVGSMGWVAVDEGDLSRAARQFHESLDLVRDRGWLWWQTNMLDGLTEVSRRLGKFDEMAKWARESLVLADQLSDRQSMVFAIASLALAAGESGDTVRAGRLWGAVEAEESRGRIGQWESERQAYEEAMSALADEGFERGRSEGRRHTLQEAVAAALA